MCLPLLFSPHWTQKHTAAVAGLARHALYSLSHIGSLRTFFFLILRFIYFILYLWVFFFPQHVHMWTTCMPGTCRGRKRVLHSLELTLWMVMRSCGGVWNLTWDLPGSHRCSRLLCYLSIPPFLFSEKGKPNVAKPDLELTILHLETSS